MKKGILIDAISMGTNWVGGLYYCKNIAFVLSQNESIINEYNIIICCRKEHRSLFCDLKGVRIVCPFSNQTIIIKYFTAAVTIWNHCKIWYWRSRSTSIPGVRSVAWIPDFQHKCYPEFFTTDDIRKRDELFESVAGNNIPLVLSSNNCLDDYRKYYSESYEKVYVVPFVSYIETDVVRLKNQFVSDTLYKYGIKKKYAVVMNQFWQHKNHKIVFEAIDILYSKHPDTDLEFVFTGEMRDYRNPDYIQMLKGILNHSQGKEHIKILGFISREEQLAIMKGSAFVIQPSLFEGWGTVVEDAKVLDKTVLLSDIPVHQEQKNENSVLFDPEDSSALAELIRLEAKKEHIENCKKGIADMYDRAKHYSKGFEQLLIDLENLK